jgi:hypothetical protein
LVTFGPLVNGFDAKTEEKRGRATLGIFDLPRA